MIKQIDRVINDLRNQVVQFRHGGGHPICVAVIGINHAETTVGYEGDRPFPTTGKQGFLHPFQEAPEAERRLLAHAAREFDEFLVLKFKAIDTPPYPFEWVDYQETRLDYSVALSRISARYQHRFRVMFFSRRSALRLREGQVTREEREHAAFETLFDAVGVISFVSLESVHDAEPREGSIEVFIRSD